MKRWTDPIESRYGEIDWAALAKLAARPPVYRPPIFPPGWTMTACGPLPPGWTVVDGKPVKP